MSRSSLGEKCGRGESQAHPVETISNAGRHRHADGLCLHAAPGGVRCESQRIVVNGNRRDIGLGPYPLVGLAKARDLAADNRAAAVEGRDPMAEKQAAKEAARNPRVF